ncbi:hypothetical protein Tco_0216759 [Tanacetum coccineum]
MSSDVLWSRGVLGSLSVISDKVIQRIEWSAVVSGGTLETACRICDGSDQLSIYRHDKMRYEERRLKGEEVASRQGYSGDIWVFVIGGAIDIEARGVTLGYLQLGSVVELLIVVYSGKWRMCSVLDGKIGRICREGALECEDGALKWGINEVTELGDSGTRKCMKILWSYMSLRRERSGRGCGSVTSADAGCGQGYVGVEDEELVVTVEHELGVDGVSTSLEISEDSALYEIYGNDALRHDVDCLERVVGGILGVWVGVNFVGMIRTRYGKEQRGGRYVYTGTGGSIWSCAGGAQDGGDYTVDCRMIVGGCEESVEGKRR